MWNKSSKMATSTQTTDIKQEPDHKQLERIESHGDDGILKQRFQDVDDFGAHKKTDPAEIALVRKMDWFVIVSFWTFTLSFNSQSSSPWQKKIRRTDSVNELWSSLFSGSCISSTFWTAMRWPTVA